MPLPLKSWFPQLVKRYLLCKGSLCSPRRRDNERIPPDPGNSLPQLDPRDGIPYWIPIPQGQALLFLKEAVRCTVIMREESSGESSAGGKAVISPNLPGVWFCRHARCAHVAPHMKEMSAQLCFHGNSSGVSVHSHALSLSPFCLSL